MSSKKDHEMMDNLNDCFSLVQQSSAKGISAQELAKKLGKHRTTVHGYLSHLEITGRVESQHGLWYPKAGEHTIKPLEKEIVIKLPLPKDEVNRMVLLENSAKLYGRLNDPENIFKITLDKLEETRTIRITGKNVDDLDLQKVSQLVKEATESRYKVKLKNLFRKSKKPQLSD
jgi:hypothetical protein